MLLYIIYAQLYNTDHLRGTKTRIEKWNSDGLGIPYALI